LNEDVSRIERLRGDAPATCAVLHRFGRDQDLAERVIHARLLDTLSERELHLLLEAGVDLHHVPLELALLPRRSRIGGVERQIRGARGSRGVFGLVGHSSYTLYL